MKVIVTVNGMPIEELKEVERSKLEENIMKKLKEKGLKRINKR